MVFSDYTSSDFIWDFGKLPFPEHLGIFIIKIWKISAKKKKKKKKYVFVVRHVIYLFIIIPDEANMAKRWISNNN